MKVKIVSDSTIDIEKVINTEISKIEKSGYSVVDVQPIGIEDGPVCPLASVMIKYVPAKYYPDGRI